jgi:fructose/tagatose bisphosphate aldolase
LKLNLDSTVSVRFKRNFENVWMILKVLSDLHEVDVVVETEVGIDHDNSERVNRNLGLHSQKGLEDVSQLGNDPLAIK